MDVSDATLVLNPSGQASRRAICLNLSSSLSPIFYARCQIDMDE